MGNKLTCRLPLGNKFCELRMGSVNCTTIVHLYYLSIVQPLCIYTICQLYNHCAFILSVNCTTIVHLYYLSIVQPLCIYTICQLYNHCALSVKHCTSKLKNL